MDLSELWGFLRFATGLKAFLRQTISPEQARALVRKWVNQREERLIQKMESAVFGFARSPYLKLFRAAGCELEDVRKLVQSRGVEGTLRHLFEAGIYVRWEELKGRQPARRGGETFEFTERDFDNPLNKGHYRASSSGSSGTPGRVGIDLEDHAESAPDWSVWFAAWGWMDRPLVLWTPTHAGMANRYLKCAKLGAPYTKWFATARMSSLEDRFRSFMVHGLARLVAGYSRPELVPVDAPERVGAHLIGLLTEGHKPLVNTAPSLAARLSLAVQQSGRSLEGVTFLLGAEPVTEARRKTIEACGAVAVPTYGTSEGGWIGAQFPGARLPDEVHIFRDAYAIIGPKESDSRICAGAPILLTNLRWASPKVLLNAEIGDSAVIAVGAADAAASELGYDIRMHTIRSFRKITAWGVTFGVSDLYSVVEDALPRELGGTLQDYQLVEEQDSDGLSYLLLLVSPRVKAVSDQRIRELFLREIEKIRPMYGFMTTVLSQAGAIRIERREPITTGGDKVLPVLPQQQR